MQNSSNKNPSDAINNDPQLGKIARIDENNIKLKTGRLSISPY